MEVIAEGVESDEQAMPARFGRHEAGLPVLQGAAPVLDQWLAEYPARAAAVEPCHG